MKILNARFKILASLILSVSACQTTAVTNRRALHIMPEAQVNQMGEDAYSEIRKKEKLEKNPKVRQEIINISKRIAKASGVDFEWEFEVIDEPKTVNAFCLPGGKIAVYTGILPVAENNAALAAVIGHEVAHATLKHGGERVSQQLLASGLQVGLAAFADPKYRDLIVAGFGLGAQFGILMPYGRKHESEADYVGLIYMAKAGYDPRESVTLWQRMAKAGGGGVPEFLSTHPDPLKRSKTLEGKLAEVMPDYEKSDKVRTVKLTLP